MTISNLPPIPVQEIAAPEEKNYEEDVDNIFLGEKNALKDKTSSF